MTHHAESLFSPLVSASSNLLVSLVYYDSELITFGFVRTNKDIFGTSWALGNRDGHF